MTTRLQVDVETVQRGVASPSQPDDPRWLGAAREHGLRDVVRWMATRRPARWPRWIDPPPPAALGDSIDTSDAEPFQLNQVTLINHSTVLLELGGLNVLTDPIFSERCSPISFAGPKRCRAPGVSLADLPRIDLVLLSHDHYDHCDRASLATLEREHQPVVVTGTGNAQRLRSFGLSRVIELNWWQYVDLAPGAAPLGRLTYVPAQHFSGRGAFDRNRAAWGGFVLESADGPVYFAGDTGYSESLFDRLHDVFGSMWFAALPIGAYEPRWFMGPVHMDPAEAVEAHVRLRSRLSLGMHYGTFQLTDEAVDAPLEELAVSLRGASIDEAGFLAPRHFGERLSATAPESP